MRVQAVLFSKRKWNARSGSAWMKSHGHTYIKIHETDNYFRFRVIEPVRGRKYKIKNIGNGILFVIEIVRAHAKK